MTHQANGLTPDTARAPRRTAYGAVRPNRHWPHVRGSRGRSAPGGVAGLAPPAGAGRAAPRTYRKPEPQLKATQVS
jgi:hypothetical protein